MFKLLSSALVALALVSPLAVSPAAQANAPQHSTRGKHKGHWEYGVEYLYQACWYTVGFYLTVDAADDEATRWELKGYSTNIYSVWVEDK
jgi:hypothetical protein